MARYASTLHLIFAITLALSVFQPLIDSTPQDEPEDEAPSLGSIVISLVGSDGSTVGGACFDVLDVNGGVSSVCDGDGDGTASLGDLPAGPVTVRQTSAVAGYEFASEGYGTVPAGDTGYVTLTAPVVVIPTEEPQPTEIPEPTAEPDPTEIPELTEEPETSVSAADVGIMAAGDISIACQHQAGSSGSTFGIEVEDKPGDVQPFSITIVPYDLQGNPLPPQEFTSSPVILDNENWRRIDITVQFSDGTTGTAVGGCNNDPIETSITTTPYTADGQPIPDGGSIDPGTTMYDTASLDGQSVDAAGTVTYYLYDTADCSGDPVFVSGPLDVVNGVVPDSGTYTPTAPGNYEWVVVYSGDIDQGNPQTNSHFNGPAESGCGEESVIVGQVDTSITTSMMTENGDPIPQGATIPQGTGVYDTATLNGATADATGTVTYTLYAGDCPGTPVPGATFTVDVANGVVPDSGVVSDLPIGTYNWVVSYSGDDKNAPSESGCGDEMFAVDKAEPTVTTTMFDADDNEIADGAVVPVGTSMYDTAAIDGYGEPLTGTVTYALYDSADCGGTPVAGPFEVEIGPDGTIPPSPLVDLASTGTYNWVVTYSGNDANEAATSDCGSETVNVEPASPDITTEIFNADDDSVVDPGSVIPEDSSVYDTATLDGATDDATGTVTFYLYNNFTCTGEPYYEVTVDLNEDGTIPPTPPVGPLPGGTWNWVAVYSGDENNNPASTACGDEEFFIGQGEGGITTMVEDENGTQYPDGSEVEVDTVLRDTAVLDGVTPDAGGTVTFYLYEGADCSSDPIFTSEPVDVVDGELVGPSETYTFEDQGTYQWVASYSGDENNAPVTSPCGAETIVVVGKPSSVTTVMYEGAAGGTEIPNNGRVLEGTTVVDTAIVDPAEATGTLTFDLYDNANCSGDPIQVFADVSVDTDAWPSVTIDEPGTYNWVVSYSGDDDYAASVSSCSSETFYIALQPTITTIMVDENGDEIPNNTVLQAGDLIGDTAVLDGATDDASGTVTYNFYLGPDCSGTPIFAPQVTVTNGEVPPSGVVEPPFLGEWSIQAVYSGNNTNFPATSECGTENFTIDPESTPTISTTMRADGEVIPQGGEIRFLPADVTDTVNLFGVVPGSTGTVTFELYKSSDCSGDAVFTDIQTDVEITTTTLSFTSDSSAISTAEWGTYNWVVTWDGDLNGDGESDVLISGCGDETFVGVTQNDPTVTIGCTYNADTQLTTFRVLVAKPTTADPDIDPELIVVATPTDNFLNPLDSITYHAYDSSNPESGVDFIAQPWRQLTVAVTWPDGQTGSAFANCNTNKLTPTLTTAMFAVPETPIENGSTVEIGTEVYDTAVLTDGTTRWSGTLTYTLYNSADCASGTEVGTAQVFTLDPNDTTLPPSAPVTIDLPGSYNWVVSYSGDDNNQPAVSGCGEESFTVDPVEVSVLTQVYLASDDSAVPDDAEVPFGTVIYDTTTLDGALVSVSGDVTYTLYTTEDCSGDAAYTETVTIANGTVPPSGEVTVDQAGTWNWVVSYGGDQVHAAATSTCGDETVVVSKATPTITTLLSTEEASAGDEVYDTAILSGASADAGGTVTYVVYANRGCFGEPLYTFDPVTVENGMVPNSPVQVFDTPGHYEWQAIYSGDDNNEPATSVCGTEPLDILAPDVVVEKTAGDLLIPAGAEASFTITVSNTGSGNAYDVVVTDVLPAGIEWTIDPAVDGCAASSGTLECAFDVIEPGESISITVVGATDPTDCGFLTNVASASASNEPDTVLANNTDRATLRVNCPDLRVRKTTDTPVVNASDEIRFSIEVRNVGLGQAQDVTLTDTLPAGNTWTIDPANESCEIAGDGVTLTCEIGTLTFGQAFTVGVVGETNPQECGLLVNAVAVEASNEAEAALANNVDEVEVLVLCPELVVSKTASSGVVSAGDPVSYTITVANLGEGTAYNVVMTDTLPAGIDWTIDPAVEGCAIADDGVTLTCSFGDVPTGTSIPVTVTGVTDAADCGLLLNRALVEGDNEDGQGDISNQSNLSRIEVLCSDILVEKTAGADEVSAGDQISFTITVTNLGPGEAYDVTINDALNPVIDGWTIDPAVEGCEISDATLDCAFDAMDPYTSIDVTVTGVTDAADCGTVTNTAMGTASNEPEDATGNNSGSAEVTVLCPDLAIEKTTDTPIVSAGDPISYTIEVSNIGEGRADGVTIEDTLPAGISWEIDPAVEGCSITDGDPETLGCDIGAMESGDTFAVTVVGITNAASCGVVTNTATVEAANEIPLAQPVAQWQSTGATTRLLAQDLPVDENNSSSVDVQVLCPDVTVEKTAADSPISAGDVASFTITVSNIGEGNAYDVQVVDDLPGDIDWAMTPSVNGCAIADGELDCTFAALAPGASVDIVVSGTTNAESCGVLLNQVDVTASNETPPDDEPVERSTSIRGFGRILAQDEPSPTDNNTATASIEVLCPEITVEKTTDTPIVSAGDQLSFTITVSNVGEGNAYGVMLYDLLPEGIEWTIEPSVDGCSIAANGIALTCDVGTLGPGESFAVTVVGEATPERCGVIINLAAARAANEPDDDELRNADLATSEILCPDIVVEKTTDTPVVSASDEIGFSITVSNAGEGYAYGVELTDVLPAGIEWVIDPANDQCTIAGDGVTLTCDIGTMLPGDEFTVAVTGVTDPTDCGVIPNVAAASGTNEPESAAGNNESTAEIEILCPDIEVEKTAAESPISAGDQAGFTITVTNIGEGVAYDVDVIDTLPAGIEWTIDPAVDGCSIVDDGVTLTCAFTTLAPDESVDITVVGTTASADCGLLPNEASASAANESDDATGNNEADADITVLCPDIVVEKTAGDLLIAAGDDATFTISVTNTGAGNAYDVTVTDPLPPDIAWTIAPPVDGCQIVGATLDCTFAELAPDETVDITLVGETDAADCGLVTNVASASASNEPDDATGNNEDQATLRVNCPDLRVRKTTDTPVVNAGDEIRFGIEVRNVGVGRADDVALTDTLPEGNTWAIDPANDSCAIAGNILTCEIGTLAPGQVFTVGLVGETNPQECGILINSVTVEASNESDAALANNVDEVEVQVLCPELVVYKTNADGVVSAGDPISYTITVANLGEGAAYNVVMTDTLPAGIEWVIDPAVDGCAIGDDGVTLTCSFAEVPSGTSIPVTVTGVTDAADCGLLTNRAFVEGDNEDGSGRIENESNLSRIEVLCPDVMVEKTAAASPISAGDEASFTITVANVGEGTAYDVELIDPLPTGIDWVVDPAVDGCAITDGTLACSFAELEAESAVDITVVGLTDAADCGLLPNVATASASNEAADVTGNNESSAEIDVLCPDIVVEKTAGDLLIPAGAEASFTITVSNPGEGTAYDVTVNDPLPAGIEWTIDPAVDGCAITGGTLECAFAILEPGAEVDITVVGTTDAADCGFLTNVASASASNEPDDATGNNEDRATLRVNCPDIQVRKTTDTPVVSAGDEIRFSIEVRNIGLGQASDVTLTDTLPAGNTWTIDPANPDCEIAGDGVTLTCEIGTLAFGEVFTVGVAGDTNPQECGILTNTVTASASNEPDSSLANNVDEIDVQVLCPELVVFKTASSGVVSAGDAVSYTITVANLGAGTAYNVVMTDTLPAGIDWTIDPAVEGCAIDDDGVTLTCSFAEVASGTLIPVTVTGVTDAADCGLLVNQAIVEGENEDGSGRIRNESNRSRIEVLCSDILVEKTAGADEISAGDPISFTITVTNLGPGEAYDVTVNDALNPAIDGWTIDPAVEGCEIADATLDCAFDAMDPYTSIDVTVTGVTDAADCGVIDNTATGTASNEQDEATDNNSGSASVTVLCPDVVLEKSAADSPISAGDQASFTITVSNIGEGNAYDVVIEDELPASIDWAIDPAVDGCTIEDGTLICTIAELTPEESASVTVVGDTDAADCGILPNLAAASASNEPDDAAGNNEAGAEIAVLCPDVAVEKTAANTPISAGEQASFTITISNIGDGNAYDVELSDPLPAGVEWTIDPPVDGCAITDNVMTCAFGTLVPGQAIDVTVVGTPTASACGVLLNVATGFASNEALGDEPVGPADRAGWMQANDVIANNQATAEIMVLCPDIVVEKTAADDSLMAGDRISFTMTVTNVGEGNAYGVVITDELPAGFNWRADSDGASCEAVDTTLTCTIAELVPGESVDIVVSAPTTTSNCGTIVNTATGSASNEPDDATGNNTSDATVVIECPPPVTPTPPVTPDTPGTPIHTLPVTGDGGTAGSSLPTWGLLGAAFIALAAAVTLVWGTPTRRR